MARRLKHRLRRFLSSTSGRLLVLTNIKDVDETPYQELKSVIPRPSNVVIPRLDRGISIVCLNLRKPKSLDGLPVKLINDFISVEDRYAIDRFVFKDLSLNWYRNPNVTDHKGIPLGDVLQYDFQKFVTPRIKNRLLLKRLWDASPFDRLLVLEDTGELASVAQGFAEEKSIPYALCNPRGFFKTRAHSTLRVEWRSALALALSALGASNHARSGSGTVFQNPLGLHRVREILSGWFSERLTRNSMGRLGNGILVDVKLQKLLKDHVQNLIPMILQSGLGIRRRTKDFFSLHLTPARSDKVHWKKRWRHLQGDDAFIKQFQYEDVSLWPWVKDELSRMFSVNLPRISRNIDFLDNFFETKKISKMVFRNDHREFEKSCILVGRQHGVKSIVVQHGILAEFNGHSKLWADRMAAWGPASLDWYKEHGNDPKKLTVTGNPKFDHLVSWKPSLSKTDLCNRVGLDPDKKIILYVTQQINKFSSFWTDDLFYVMAEDIGNIVKSQANAQLLIKADPFESVDPYKKILNACGVKNGAAVRDIPVHEILPHSDLVVILDSTVGLEAMFFNKPLITYNVTGRKDRIPFSRYSAAIRVDNKEALAKVIRNCHPEARRSLGHSEPQRGEESQALTENQQSFVHHFAFELDGHASQRLASLLKT